MRIPTFVVRVTAILATTGAIQAQDPPSWNRKAEAISVQVVPVEGSLFDVNCYVSIDASDLTGPVDLSTELELRVNGVVQFTQTFQLIANPTTHADCSGLNCGNEPCFCTPPPLPGFPDDDEEEQVLCPWDCGNGDLLVGIEDFLALLSQWNEIGSACDFKGDGVNINDFLELLANWGPFCDV